MRALLLTLTICLITIPAYAKYSGGTGEPNDPYQIATAEDIMLLGETPEDYDKHFILTADIDLDPNLPGRKVFDRAVIAPDTNDVADWFQGTAFIGVFDGNDHTISHLTITGQGHLGLFGQLWSGGKVTDLGLVEVSIAGSGDYVGGLVGENFEGILSRCYSTGTIGGSRCVGGLVGANISTVTKCYSNSMVIGGDSVGGLIGYSDLSSVADCYSSGAVMGKDRVGGLIGETGRCSVIDCYNASPVMGNEYVGGLVGWTDDFSHVTHCYNTSSVTGNDYVGGLIGGGWGGSLTHCYSTGSVISTGQNVGGLVGSGPAATACFWDTQTSGQENSDGGIGKTTAEMKDPNTFRAVGWDFVGLQDGPHDIWAVPEGGGYPILWWQVPSEFGLPTFSAGIGEPNDPYIISTEQELNSIGHNPRLMECHFQLAFDLDLAGVLFYPIGNSNYGYGGVFNGKGRNISHLTIKGESLLGLFDHMNGEVRDLGVVDVNLVGSGPYVGGLAGINRGTVTKCYSTGTVSTTAEWSNTGGLVGSNGGIVTQSYSTCTVIGNSVIGGLVGTNHAAVSQCYSTGTISGIRSIGGLVGSTTGDVTQSYSTSMVSGDRYVGGLVGDNFSSSITSCFWDTQTSGQTESAGGMGKTTAEMQMAQTFLDAGWDFVGETANGTEDIWWIDEGQDYPRLWWEMIPEN